MSVLNFQKYAYALELTFTFVNVPVVKLIESSNAGDRVECVSECFAHVNLLLWNIRSVQSLE